MREKNERSLNYLLIVLVLGVQRIAGVAKTTFSCAQKAVPNESFHITCSITGAIVNGIQWIRPDGNQVASCFDSTNCLDLVPGYTITSKTNSENVLQIASMGIDDGGNWTCQDGSGGTKGCSIIVQKTPTTTLTIQNPKQQIYSVGAILVVSVDLQNYYCSKAPSFHLLLDSQRVELDALPSTPSTTLSGTQTKSITVTEDMTGSTKLVFNCRDDEVIFDEKTFEIPAITTEPPTSSSASDCSIIVTIIMIIINVIKVLAFIILLIAICSCNDNLKVLQALYIVDVISAVAAIIGGIVCLVITVTAMTTCEGPICITNLCLSIIAVVMGLVNLLIIIFFLGSMMDNADVKNRHLACHICAFPGGKDDNPTREDHSPTNATIRENSRGNDSQGSVAPKSKTMDGTKVSSL